MNSIKIGHNKIQKEGFKAFIPLPFPPESGFMFDMSIIKKANEATRLLGKLDGITKLLPDSDFFLLMYLRKDAASSSQIEGTVATMVDAIEADVHLNTDLPQDVDDILHYIKALNYGIKRLKEDGFPISLRFVCELHGRLMKGARSTQHSYPGEFRRTQNWIGGTTPNNAKFVPPPVDDMKKSLFDLENFIYKDDYVLDIIKAAIIHAQFETIHPFTDGNGRTGRMLITFYLWKVGLLEKPVLFLSSYFKKNQNIYYEKLQGYHSEESKVYEWVDFFIDGVIDIANEAIDIVHKITDLKEKDMMKIQKLSKRASESATIVLLKLYEQPIVDVSTIQKWTGFTRAGAQTVINRFIEVSVLSPKNLDKKYAQTYIYKKYIDIFNS